MIESVRIHQSAMLAGAPTIWKDPIPWFTMIVVGTLLFVVGHSFSYSVGEDYSTVFVTVSEAIAEGSPKRRLGYFLFGLWGSAVILLRQPRYALRLDGLLPWIALGYLCWAILSLLWASDFSLTLRRLVVFAMVVAAVVACLRQLSLRNIVLLIAVLSFTYAVIGLTAELVYGTFQPLSGDYRFAGTSHPNRQGMNIARGLLAVACLYSMRIPGRWLLIIVGLAGFVLLVLTKSRTATGAALIGLATFAALRLPPAKVALLIVTGATLGVLSIFLIQNQVMSTPLEIILMGRQHEAGATTLSGRTELWKILFGYAIERPIVGYGFHSFMSPEWVSQLSVQARWFGGEAHSLYIEILLGTGFVGLALFVTALLGSCARGFRWVTKSRDPALAFLVAYLVFVVFNGFLTAITIYPDPKFVGVLVLGYVLFRDPERDAAAAGAVPDAYSGQFSVPPHSGGTPGVPDWPPVHGAGVPPHFPRR